MGKTKTQNQSAKERMKRYREKIKANPELYDEAKKRERERYKKRVDEGKIKTAQSNMTSRERRKLKKNWREKTRKYRANVKTQNLLMGQLEDNSPPHTPPQPGLNKETGSDQTDKRKQTGKNKRRKYSKDMRNKIKELEFKLKKAETKVAKFRQQVYRSKEKSSKKDETPSKVMKLLDQHKVPASVRKNLVFGAVVIKQIKESFKNERNRKKKRDFFVKLAGSVVKKYKCFQKIKNITTRQPICVFKSSIDLKKRLEKSNAVQEFLERDENSTMTPGKKQTITRHKMKKQIRYLNGTLKHLHCKFLNQNPQKHISYPMFCALKPFWVIAPQFSDRDTCLCTICENFNLICKKLKALNVISESSSKEIINSMICSESKSVEQCLEKKCKACYSKSVTFNNYDPLEDTVSTKWVTKKSAVTIKGKEKIVQKTIKEVVSCKIKDLVTDLNKSIPKYFQHVSNIKHQYQAIDFIKKNLKSGEVLIHMDFSENYGYKYAREVQGAHFGASKAQVSLHTVVAYYIPSGTESLVQKKSFGTFSENLRHDPAAICGHLNPVLKNLEALAGDIVKVHFVSDGPTTQYRNRFMFFMVQKFLPSALKTCESIHWHYSESGHGKGAPDGIGGTLKRTADRLVATGFDMANFQVLYNALKEEIKNVAIFIVEDELILKMDKTIPDKNQIPTFNGTMKVHEVIWLKEHDELQFRRLSCLTCFKECKHYGIGAQSFTCNPLPKKLRYEEVYSSSEDESELKDEQGSDNSFLSSSLKNLKEHDWCLVEYEKELFPGEILKIEENQIKVSCMTSSGKYWKWPNRPDILLYGIKDVKCILSPPQVVNSRGHFKFESIPNGLAQHKSKL